MVTDLNDLKVSVPTRSQRRTDTISCDLSAGQTLKLESAPDGEEFATGTVPTGKAWHIEWSLSIVETDA